MKNIIVAVDGSEAANVAAKFANKLAQETQAKITLMFVYDAPGAAVLGLNSLSPVDLEIAEREVSKNSFEAAKKAIGDTSVTIETYVTIGNPGTEIVSHAKSHSADMIVMGRRGLTNLQKVFLGSVSNFVVQHAHCPVTLVH